MHQIKHELYVLVGIKQTLGYIWCLPASHKRALFGIAQGNKKISLLMNVPLNTVKQYSVVKVVLRVRYFKDYFGVLHVKVFNNKL